MESNLTADYADYTDIFIIVFIREIRVIRGQISSSMKLSEMKQVLAERGIQLTKSLGQNFLHDGNQLHRIVEAAQLGPNDPVLEIGPGLGPLTDLLLARAGRVLAIEKDRRLFEVLQQRFKDDRKIELLHADALDYLQEKRDWRDWKMVSNLPYSVASRILVELAQSSRAPVLIVATLQIDVARRIMAEAGSADFGALTLLLQLRYEPAGHFKIPAGCFFPEPEIDSACITLKRRSQSFLGGREEETLFREIVKQAFSQRRKMMHKLLKQKWPEPQVEQAFACARLSANVRAENVTLQQFVELTRALAPG